MRKVRPGEPLNIPAEAYNRFIDAARALTDGQTLFRPGRTGAGIPACTVLAYNASFETAPICGAVQIATGGHTARQVEFEKPGDTGISYAIALEPVPAGEMGVIAVSGGPWPLACAEDVWPGQTVGPVSGSWTAGTGSKWRVCRRSVDGVALVRFAGWALEVRDDDPPAPAEGDMWLRRDLT